MSATKTVGGTISPKLLAAVNASLLAQNQDEDFRLETLKSMGATEEQAQEVIDGPSEVVPDEPIDHSKAPHTQGAATFDRKAQTVTVVLRIDPQSTKVSGTGKSYVLGTAGGTIDGKPWRIQCSVTRPVSQNAPERSRLL